MTDYLLNIRTNTNKIDRTHAPERTKLMRNSNEIEGYGGTSDPPAMYVETPNKIYNSFSNITLSSKLFPEKKWGKCFYGGKTRVIKSAITH